VKAWISLSDYAQVHAGKTTIVGGGVLVAYLPLQLGVTAEILVPWTSRSKRVPFRIDLIDSDSRPVMAPTLIPGVQQAPLQIAGVFEVVPPSGSVEGSEIPFSVAFTVNGLPLQLNASYVWRLFIADEDAPTIIRSFSTAQRPLVVQPI